MSALRYNDGKTRFELVPPKAVEELAKVLTKGSEKYGDRNWERGMKWSVCLASLKRHIHAFETGEDFDAETGLLHLSHAMCNIAFLIEYYTTHPECDDRQHSYLFRHISDKRVGLDIDDVLADFTPHFKKRFNITDEFWNWNDPRFRECFSVIRDDEEFWMGIPPKTLPKEIPFSPACYITSRPPEITEITERWLKKWNFPDVKCFCVKREEKLRVAIEQKLDIFVDDNFQTFREFNKGGIVCYLMTMDHNRRHNVGYKRIEKLSDVVG